ncbi:MAG: bifunctional 5,10-methylenetetrahydrofolate dehydrogenase/5,10-methenyltetrahydrofolate cyclohydrolase [Deltaproteobacteria bacterium]|jgi:methylenetetrahydrofolate dehydrogenase (NADP+)/methenyltetrahydrofolate cyclohydrolase|nr:bifunctional 5,10-methylenetetrahydrofolate dehydrogenase/5,10-methenyltetrahydrofolate cyclohydrolase [Deltaproteobacteria bacterium]
MPAQIIKGLPVANAIREELIPKVKALVEKGVQPKLAVVLAGGDEASKVYAQAKEKVGDKLGIKVEIHIRPDDVTQDDLLKLVDQLNADPNVHGILVELPLPKHIQKELIMNRLDPKKDVDGVHPVNRGYLLGGQEHLALVPATPLSCIELIQRSGVDLKGRRVALVGRGDTVGRPLASLLIKRDATITVCHTKTVDMGSITKAAEIVVAAAGSPGLVKASMLSPGQTVIDAGINQLPDNSIIGDVEPAAADVVAFLTPVPGGVGSLTTSIIMSNLLKAVQLQGLS